MILKYTVIKMFSLLKKVYKFPIVKFPFTWSIISSFLYCRSNFVLIFFTRRRGKESFIFNTASVIAVVGRKKTWIKQQGLKNWNHCFVFPHLHHRTIKKTTDVYCLWSTQINGHSKDSDPINVFPKTFCMCLAYYLPAICSGWDTQSSTLFYIL